MRRSALSRFYGQFSLTLELDGASELEEHPLSLKGLRTAAIHEAR